MATVRKRGNSYQIRVSCGYDCRGKQIEKSLTWRPAAGMTKKQIEKELERQKVLFEEKCKTGLFLGGNMTFEEFSELYFKDYALQQLRSSTITRYKSLMRRILPAIGRIKMDRIKPRHLMELYNSLGKESIRFDTKYKPCENFSEVLTKAGYTKKALSDITGVSLTTIKACVDGNNVTQRTVDKLSAVIKYKDLFTVIDGNAKLTNKTILEHHLLISSIFRVAVQWQVIPSNPASRVKPPKVQRCEAVSLDEKQAAQLILCLQSEPIKYHTAIMLALYTGLRRGEICGLNWSDIDFENNLISINKSVGYLPDIGVYEDSTKTKSSVRIISIPPDMAALLRRYRAHQSEQRLLRRNEWNDSGKVFTSANGSTLNPYSLSTWFKQFVKRYNLPEDIHLHSLRHTAATLLIANGVDIATVSKRLGHSNKTTTLNIYTHSIMSADKAASDKLQDILAVSKNRLY